MSGHPERRGRPNALVLGGGSKDPLADGHNVATKALIPVAGRSMAWHVLSALRGSGGIGRITYVGPTTPEVDDLIDARLPDAGSLLANVEAGLRAEPPGARLLVATADVPMISPAAVRDLLERDPGAAVVYPVVTAEASERDFPGGRRTFARLRDGRFTGGNLFFVDREVVLRALPQLKLMIERRKNPLAMAQVIGLLTLARL
ncbi:MAG TPA: nucleotidyltransferase family protein [Deinococcales bacterium]|nr:nucleotidyltransferase family protein [Deinococcales bacterium]